MIRLAVKNAFSDPEALAVQLNVFPENERAKRCYEGAGFTERKTTPDAFKYQDESWEDAIWYKKEKIKNYNG